MAGLALYLATLAATLLVELPVVGLVGTRIGIKPPLAAAICINLASHPLASALTSMLGVPWLWTEACVVVLEALAYFAVLRRARQAWVLSGAANGVTAGLALLLQ